MSLAEVLVTMERGAETLHHLAATVRREGSVGAEAPPGSVPLFSGPPEEPRVEDVSFVYRRDPLEVVVDFPDSDVIARVTVTPHTVVRALRDGRSETRDHRPGKDDSTVWHLVRPFGLFTACSVTEVISDSFAGRPAWRVLLVRHATVVTAPLPAIWGAARYEVVVDAEFGYAMALVAERDGHRVSESLHDVVSA